MAKSLALKTPGRARTSKEWLPIGELYVDERYQRPLDSRKVRLIAENLDPDAIGLPLVTEMPRRGGRGVYAIVDGQHRHAALLQAFGTDQLIECEVVRGVSIERAAQLFRLRNQSTKPRTIDRFLAAVTAGEADAVAIDKIVRSVGLQVDRVRKVGTVQAVGAMEKIYRGDRGMTDQRHAVPLKRTLVIAGEAWPENCDAFNGDIIGGLGLVILRHGDTIDTDALIRKLRQYAGGPLSLLGAARGHRGIIGGQIRHAVAGTITALYNRGRGKGGILPDWRPDRAD